MKQKILTMSEKELTRYNMIKQCLEKKSSRVKAAGMLNISVRHVKRLLSRYQQQGIDALISKRRGQPSNNQIPKQLKQLVLKLVRENYQDFGATFAHEKLFECHGHLFSRSFSVETLRKWMIEARLHQPKRRNTLIVHQSRPRQSNSGNLIQIDGSIHDWFEGRAKPCTLIAFIDDATSAITLLRFFHAETTSNYMQCLRQYIDCYGYPRCLYSDRHSIFSNNAKEQHTMQQPTQFSRALKQLDIQLYTANSPQAKGRVERLFKTLQDRLVKEMRLQGICSIDQANQFLEQYRLKHNQQFAKKPLDSRDNHRKLSHSDRDLDLVFSKQHTRKLSKNLSCQYRNIQYLIKTKKPCYAMRGAAVTVCELLNGEIVLLYKGHELPYTIHQEHSPRPEPLNPKTINPAVDALLRSSGKGYKPKSTHPWKRWNPDHLNAKQE